MRAGFLLAALAFAIAACDGGARNKCLPAATLIATPAGDVPVRELTPGAPVWTRNAKGERVAGRILQTHHVPAILAHELVRVRLGDERVVSASVGHPLANGRGIETLVPRRAYDGATVVSVERIRADSGGTYDLLPSGETGVYWADGVPLGSTLWAMPRPESAAASPR